MDMGFYWVKDKTRQGQFFIYWGLGKTNKADYFTKNHPPSHHKTTRHEYPHKANNSLRFFPPRGCINHKLGLNSPDMSHEPLGPKSNRKEPGGSTSDCLTLVPKDK